MKRTALLLAVWLIGCGAASETGRDFGCGWTPDPELHGARLNVDDCLQDWCFAPDVKDRVRATIEAGADYWGEPYTVLYGWRIRVVEGDAHCTGLHADAGCVDWMRMTVVLSNQHRGGIAGPEWSALVHEMGHVALAFCDTEHWDSRWWDDESLADTFYDLTYGRCGYEEDGEPTRCVYRDWYRP